MEGALRKAKENLNKKVGLYSDGKNYQEECAGLKKELKEKEEELSGFLRGLYKDSNIALNDIFKLKDRKIKLDKIDDKLKELEREINATKGQIESNEKINTEKIRNTVGSTPPRIPSEEMERLNKQIAEMNSDGWNIRSIQSIETGVYSYAFSQQEGAYQYGGSGYGWGYGSSFTEGVII